MINFLLMLQILSQTLFSYTDTGGIFLFILLSISAALCSDDLRYGTLPKGKYAASPAVINIYPPY